MDFPEPFVYAVYSVDPVVVSEWNCRGCQKKCSWLGIWLVQDISPAIH